MDPESVASSVFLKLKELGAKVFFEKVLTASDASGSGRVVVPKAIAEQYFPKLDNQIGLCVDAMDINGRYYTFRWRFWINNQSRMYILEGSSELQTNYQLTVGDVIVFAQQPDGSLVVAGRPGTKTDTVKKTVIKRPSSTVTGGPGSHPNGAATPYGFFNGFPNGLFPPYNQPLGFAPFSSAATTNNPSTTITAANNTAAAAAAAAKLYASTGSLFPGGSMGILPGMLPGGSSSHTGILGGGEGGGASSSLMYNGMFNNGLLYGSSMGGGGGPINISHNNNGILGHGILNPSLLHGSGSGGLDDGAVMLSESGSQEALMNPGGTHMSIINSITNNNGAKNATASIFSPAFTNLLVAAGVPLEVDAGDQDVKEGAVGGSRESEGQMKSGESHGTSTSTSTSISNTSTNNTAAELMTPSGEDKIAAAHRLIVTSIGREGSLAPFLAAAAAMAAAAATSASAMSSSSQGTNEADQSNIDSNNLDPHTSYPAAAAATTSINGSSMDSNGLSNIGISNGKSTTSPILARSTPSAVLLSNALSAAAAAATAVRLNANPPPPVSHVPEGLKIPTTLSTSRAPPLPYALDAVLPLTTSTRMQIREEVVSTAKAAASGGSNHNNNNNSNSNINNAANTNANINGNSSSSNSNTVASHPSSSKLNISHPHANIIPTRPTQVGGKRSFSALVMEGGHKGEEGTMAKKEKEKENEKMEKEKMAIEYTLRRESWGEDDCKKREEKQNLCLTDSQPTLGTVSTNGHVLTVKDEPTVDNPKDMISPLETDTEMLDYDHDRKPAHANTGTATNIANRSNQTITKGGVSVDNMNGHMSTPSGEEGEEDDDNGGSDYYDYYDDDDDDDDDDDNDSLDLDPTCRSYIWGRGAKEPSGRIAMISDPNSVWAAAGAVPSLDELASPCDGVYRFLPYFAAAAAVSDSELRVAGMIPSEGNVMEALGGQGRGGETSEIGDGDDDESANGGNKDFSNQHRHISHRGCGNDKGSRTGLSSARRKRTLNLSAFQGCRRSGQGRWTVTVNVEGELYQAVFRDEVAARISFAAVGGGVC